MEKKSIKIDATRNTPAVLLDKGHILIDGRSIPEDSQKFYKPIHDWIKEYTDKEFSPTTIDLNFEYINTSSTQWVFAVLKEFGTNPELEGKVKINWFFEEGDDDMEELGNILQSMVPHPITIIETEE